MDEPMMQRRARHRLLGVAIVAAAVVAVAGCSSDDGRTSTADVTTTAAASGSASTPAGSTPGSGSTPANTGSAVGAECENDLRIVNAEAEPEAGLSDGEIDVVTAWADGGPHPDNTVTVDDTNLELMIADYEYPKDPQFGYSIPVGIPDVPDGNLVLVFDVSTDSDLIEDGQEFVESTSTESADGTITNYGYFAGSERLLASGTVLTITSITDEVVCGTLASETSTSTQQFVGIEGTFRADRIQALEAAEE